MQGLRAAFSRCTQPRRGRQLDAVGAELGQEAGPKARRVQRPQQPGAVPGAVLGRTGDEEVLEGDDVSFIAADLRDLCDATRAVDESPDVDEEVEAAGDLLADGLDGSSTPAISTSISSRCKASRAEFAWIVVSEPSWPVFIACNMSSDSAPRTSPTMIRSGRMRRALRTRSRIWSRPRPRRWAAVTRARRRVAAAAAARRRPRR